MQDSNVWEEEKRKEGEEKKRKERKEERGGGVVGLPQFGPELKFEPELFRTGPKFGPGFNHFAELDHKFSSGFGEICKLGEPS